MLYLCLLYFGVVSTNVQFTGTAAGQAAANLPSVGVLYGVIPMCPCLRTALSTYRGCRGLPPGVPSLCQRRSHLRLLRFRQPCSWNRGAGTFEGNKLLDRTNLCCGHDEGGPPYRPEKGDGGRGGNGCGYVCVRQRETKSREQNRDQKLKETEGQKARVRKDDALLLLQLSRSVTDLIELWVSERITW